MTRHEDKHMQTILSDDFTFQQKWANLKSNLDQRFGEDLDTNGILFLIGLQELKYVPESLDKQQKTEVLHIAVCKLLSIFGYYVFEKRDEDGWPHYLPTDKLQNIQASQQNRLIQEAIIRYFEEYQ